MCKSDTVQPQEVSNVDVNARIGCGMAIQVFIVMYPQLLPSFSLFPKPDRNCSFAAHTFSATAGNCPRVLQFLSSSVSLQQYCAPPENVTHEDTIHAMV
jgi:hypothetical protein